MHVMRENKEIYIKFKKNEIYIHTKVTGHSNESFQVFE